MSNDIVYDKEKSSYFKKISFEDIDTDVLSFFENKNFYIVKQDETISKVPVIFTTEERWKKADISSEYIDSNKKIKTPLISLFRMGSFDINKEKNVVSNKGTSIIVHKEIIPEMSADFKRPFNNPTYKKNINKEVYRIIKVPYPKFYDLSYSMTIVTNMVSHMNQIIEQLYNNEYFYLPKPQIVIEPTGKIKITFDNEWNHHDKENFLKDLKARAIKKDK